MHLAKKLLLVNSAAVLLLAGLPGCAPSPPKTEELGRIVYDPAQVPGMDHPYVPPELEEAKEKPQKPSETSGEKPHEKTGETSAQKQDDKTDENTDGDADANPAGKDAPRETP